MVENRRVGIKSREIYECPGSLALILAHADLESITLERDLMREKAAPRDRATPSSSTTACGSRRSRTRSTRSSRARSGTSPARCGCGSSPGAASSPGGGRRTRLYDYELATYEAADAFRHEDAAGFVRLWGLSVETVARRQGGRE